MPVRTFLSGSYQASALIIPDSAPAGTIPHRVPPIARYVPLPGIQLLARTILLTFLEDNRLERDSVNCGHDELAKALLIVARSERHNSELQSLMRTSYAVLCL